MSDFCSDILKKNYVFVHNSITHSKYCTIKVTCSYNSNNVSIMDNIWSPDTVSQDFNSLLVTLLKANLYTLCII